MVYKNPTQVICINARNSTKLVKGAVYSAIAIYTFNHMYSNQKVVSLKEFSNYYNINNFSLIDGSSLSNLPIFNIEHPKILEPKTTNYTGQFVKCRYSSSKYMKKNEIYYVEQQFEIEKEKHNYGNQSILPWQNDKYFEYKFKIRDFPPKPLNFSGFSMRISPVCM